MMYVDVVPAKIRDFQTSAPVDVVGLARSLGINVWDGHPGPGMAGKLFRDEVNGGSAGFSIVVNQTDPYARKRFTVAHELAHFLLHRERVDSHGFISDDAWYRSGMTTSEEAEANRMAADILMPNHLIAYYQENGLIDVDALARKFEVSRQAMSIRLGLA